MLIFIIFLFFGKEVYAQNIEDIIESNRISEKTNNQDIEDNEAEKTFIVNNNTYMILKDNESSVMLLKCNWIDDQKNILINNDVEYDGVTYKIKYIYEKAFDSGIKSEESIKISNKIVGFCDSKGNRIGTLKAVFSDHKALKYIDFGDISINFGENCFQNCKALNFINMPEQMNILESMCFDKCSSLKEIALNNITSINGHSNFANCTKLESIGEFNDNLKELPEEAFLSCTNLRLSSLNNVTKIGDECFKNCSVLNNNILENVEELGDESFYNCSFDEVYLKKAKIIGVNAFGNCGALTRIRFGNSEIPSLLGKLGDNSPINEYVYPVSYREQNKYLDFISKLIFSKVIWNSNYGAQEKKVTQDVKANTLKPPNFSREGFELEGWYKEPECINKVNTIADLAELSGSDLVLKNPILYAKWKLKDYDDNKNQDGNNTMPSNQNEPNDSKDTNNANANNTNNSTKETEEGSNESKTDENNVPIINIYPSSKASVANKLKKRNKKYNKYNINTFNLANRTDNRIIYIINLNIKDKNACIQEFDYIYNSQNLFSDIFSKELLKHINECINKDRPINESLSDKYNAIEKLIYLNPGSNNEAKSKLIKLNNTLFVCKKENV